MAPDQARRQPPLRRFLPQRRPFLRRGHLRLQHRLHGRPGSHLPPDGLDRHGPLRPAGPVHLRPQPRRQRLQPELSGQVGLLPGVLRRLELRARPRRAVPEPRQAPRFRRHPAQRLLPRHRHLDGELEQLQRQVLLWRRHLLQQRHVPQEHPDDRLRPGDRREVRRGDGPAPVERAGHQRGRLLAEAQPHPHLRRRPKLLGAGHPGGV